MQEKETKNRSKFHNFPTVANTFIKLLSQHTGKKFPGTWISLSENCILYPLSSEIMRKKYNFLLRNLYQLKGNSFA